ncbi:hypothetical protein [Bacillus paranthracis]|uniref:hypothetical protein n=1 Tax=Bacillus paranthracis TaxID=2026186 RepID=UPI0024078A4C|nr:hypothetical protein [Bacillus paranthracis]MDG0891827.1 hypothetical protein [Bacillus paranthracis]MDG0931500.1 hypothetical protein [Bacillus paranthracis]
METTERLKFKEMLQKELLTSTQAANLLNVTKQRFGVLAKTYEIIPIHESSQGKLFLRRDIEELRNGRYKRNSKTPPILIHDHGNYQSPLTFFEHNKDKLNEISGIFIYRNKLDAVLDDFYLEIDSGFQEKKELDAPNLVLRDIEGKEIWFKTLNCGYSGGTPYRTVELLTKLGIDEKYARELIYNHEVVTFSKTGPDLFEGGFNNSRIEKGRSQGILQYVWNNKLIFVQKQFEGDEFDNGNTLTFLSEYISITPNIRGIIIFNSREEAIKKGYYIRDHKNNEVAYQVIIRDASNRELWLRLSILPTDKPLKYTKDVNELLSFCGINIEEPIETLPDKFKRWLTIKPPILPSEVITIEN